MARATFQVVVFPFRRRGESVEYAVFRRADAGYWQGIAGGGEDDESPLEAAKRETEEEAGIPRTSTFYRLDTVSSVPVYHFAARTEWPKDLYVTTNYSFGVDCANTEIVLSHEHTEVAWLPFAEAHNILKWDNNRTALWELDQRILKGDLLEATE